MKPATLRTLTHLTLAAAALWLAVPSGASAAPPPDVTLRMAGKGTLKLKQQPTLKQDVALRVDMSGPIYSGVWAGVDDDGVTYGGRFYLAHENMREFGVVFDAESLAKLGQSLSAQLLAQNGVQMTVVSIALRPTAMKIDMRRGKATAKLVFDLAAIVNGVFRTGTYAIPLKGDATGNN